MTSRSSCSRDESLKTLSIALAAISEEGFEAAETKEEMMGERTLRCRCWIPAREIINGFRYSTSVSLFDAGMRNTSSTR